MMMKMKFVVLAIFAISDVFAQRRDGSTVFFENEGMQPRVKQSIFSDIAQELIRRSSSSSQVLNLNLSNLLILLVLKAIVYGAGYVGNHAFKSRGDATEDNILTEGEVALALGYLIGDTCLFKAACEVPYTAKEYLGAAEMIFQTLKFMPQSLSFGDAYETTLVELQKAIDLGLKGQCPSDYNCKKDNIHRFLRPQ